MYITCCKREKQKKGGGKGKIKNRKHGLAKALANYKDGKKKRGSRPSFISQRKKNTGMGHEGPCDKRIGQGTKIEVLMCANHPTLSSAFPDQGGL